MWREWANWLDMEKRALFGAAALHLLVLPLLVTWPIEVRPADRAIVPVVLVERTLPPPAEEETPPEIAPPVEDEAQNAEPAEPVLEPEPQPEPVTAPPEPLPETPVPVSAERRPPAPSVVPSVTPEDDAETAQEAIVIDPRYKIPYDPFAETAPTALSRVVTATTCARSGRDTRPAWCPNYSDEDLYYSAFARPNDGTEPTYDPVFDIAFAQSTLERFAAGQSRHGVRSGSPELEPLTQVPRHPDGLQNCTPVQTGLEGPGGQVSGLELPLGSSDGIFCR